MLSIVVNSRGEELKVGSLPGVKSFTSFAPLLAARLGALCRDTADIGVFRTVTAATAALAGPKLGASSKQTRAR